MGLFRKGEEKERNKGPKLLWWEHPGAIDEMSRRISSMFSMLSDLLGADRLILKAGKLESLTLMRSEDLEQRAMALQRIVFQDPTITVAPSFDELPSIMDELEDELAEMLARKRLDESIEKKVTDKLQQKHEEYVKDVKKQLLSEESGPETAETQKKLEDLKKLEERKLLTSAMEAVRPSDLAQIVGQNRAIRALMAKISSPFPQHVILYGPPGVGKTSAARLVLEEAKKAKYTPFGSNAKFIEVDGTTLRWDPRDIVNPLMGSVHDPIYQGAKRDLAEGGVPEPKLGLVTEAHGGVLFIDEIGEMDPLLLNKLLKVMEDKRVSFESSYYDPQDKSVPEYIRQLFEKGAPADFILIGATTREPETLSPALRSRCAEVFFEPLTQHSVQEIATNAALRLGVRIEDGVPETISDYTIEGRKATSLLIDAYSFALYESQGSKDVLIKKAHLEDAIRAGRMTPYVNIKASDTAEVGKIFGLGVSGFLGSVIEIEAVSFPRKEEKGGNIRFNETAGSMAKDSVFNAGAVFRSITGDELAKYDFHVNVVGGGNIEGPSAGAAILLAMLSASKGIKIRQDVAVTGEISIQGKVKEVGGVFEKVYGAKQAGIKKVLIPDGNKKDVPSDITGVQIVPVDDIKECFEHIFEGYRLGPEGIQSDDGR
ncbi:MAG TPA: Lon family ATP-dependent protease [Bacillota bacterium]|nr:Lon family ATP-dependent protease [Bacillota bacterium]